MMRILRLSGSSGEHRSATLVTDHWERGGNIIDLPAGTLHPIDVTAKEGIPTGTSPRFTQSASRAGSGVVKN